MQDAAGAIFTVVSCFRNSMNKSTAPSIVIPAQAGIQVSLYCLDSGSRQPKADLAGITLENMR